MKFSGMTLSGSSAWDKWWATKLGPNGLIYFSK